ncbi:hypothetical protein [Raineyella sp. W15-4]|uniref:hypothetical protein n=1 Tax=Raineyella sp. W15-4 TaxID=3081651 RepID=UPI00295302A9|nr:hypothetical protein [Raineyella sp. W15-4]WOQ16053.1 hypothetical protein R0145_12635 [Raineyella sp. W15-4]
MASILESATASAAQGETHLPVGFSYAGGEPPAVEPMGFTRGTVASIDRKTLIVDSGTHEETFDIGSVRFTWQGGPVDRSQVSDRVRVGDHVVLVGTVDNVGHYVDLQQLWVNPPIDPVPVR